ncbi:MAG: 50S ribosomal protein L21 [Spirochaetia bacterium]|jgi:large subunit ribosomal protein L21
MYALVEILGKQYKAEKGSRLHVDKIGKSKGENVEFDSVLLLADNDKIKIGTPYVKGVKIKAQIEEHAKDKKIIVYKYKRRKDYHKKQGHRTQFTTILVTDIIGTEK